MRSVTTVGTKGERHRGRERGRRGIEGNDMYTIPVMHPLTSSSTDAVVLSGASSISTMCSSRSRRWVEFTFSSVRRCTLGGRSFDIPTYCVGKKRQGRSGGEEHTVQSTWTSHVYILLVQTWRKHSKVGSADDRGGP